MGSWADLGLPTSVVRTLIAATAAIAAAAASDDHQHENSNNKQEHHTEGHDLHRVSLGQFLELKEKFLTNGLHFLQKGFRRHSGSTSPAFVPK